jgi:hypothetical protein
MRNDFYRTAVLSALLPLLAGGCAVQGGAIADAGSGAPQATVATSQPVTAAPQPAVAAQQNAARARPQLAAPSPLETQYGIQVTQVNLTAAGGLVDFRFRVLDAAKARKLLGNPANMPVLIAGDNPPLAPPHHALHGAKFGDGLVYFILYPNVRSAVKPGAEVTVAMGDVRLGPVTVQ